MTPPEQVALISALVTIAERVGALPLTGLFLITQIGPWVMSMVMIGGIRKQYELQAAENARRFEALAAESRERFERVVAMYEANVILVKGYERLSDDQKDLLTLNIQSLTTVKDAISNNMFCPVIRDRRVYAQHIKYNQESGD